MQTIIGSTGVIGTELAKSLIQYTEEIRLVSRNPRRVNPRDQLLPADVLHPKQTMQAVEGSKVVYLTIGLPYDTKVWRTNWPKIMQNVIDACIRYQSKLVFFDNVYMYGKVDGWMTEETPVNPISKKGEVRAEIAAMLMKEVQKANLTALIARSADFYGPNTPLSFVSATVFDNLAKGKAAQWMLNDQVRHSLTYTPDAARATAILGNTTEAYNQVWHLPTARPPLNGQELIEKAAAAFGVKPRYTVLKKWMLKMAGLFTPVIRESMEMLYQNDSDYLFDSSKFEDRFRFPTTPYDRGIRETVEWYQGK